MNTMNMPGFTAEGTLYSEHGHYATSVYAFANRLSAAPRVTPQLRIDCFINRWHRTYSRCMGLGTHGSDACAEVATDVGLFACGD